MPTTADTQATPKRRDSVDSLYPALTMKLAEQQSQGKAKQKLKTETVKSRDVDH